MLSQQSLSQAALITTAAVAVGLVAGVDAAGAGNAAVPDAGSKGNG